MTAEWSWRLENAAGGVVVCDDRLTALGAASSFASQGDAETWLGETWEDLANQGIAAVTLLQSGREVYGPMGLDPSR